MSGLVFHHLGIACADIVKMRAFVCAVHAVEGDTGVVDDPTQGIQLCLLQVRGGLRLELVAGDKVQGLLNAGISYYHVCYEVDSLEDATDDMRRSGCMLVFGPVRVELFAGRRIAFLMTPMGLVELLEKER
jgi:methylmalonyl-CoA/ethylmalonyl-CoA epimerase